MKKFKKIAIISVWCLLVLGLLVTMGFVNKEQDAMLCKSLDVNVNQENELSFIDTNDVRLLLKNRGDSIVGQPKSTVDIADMEKVLNSNAAVSKAEVSVSIDGVVKVDVTQRNPVIRVINADGDSYYIDDEGRLMPLSDKYTMKVLVANGNIMEPYAKRYTTTIAQIGKDSALRNASKLDELFAMANYINADPFWKAQIHQIFINEDNDMEIVPLAGNQKIIFGDTTAMDEKFKKLMTFYKEGLNTTGWWDKYSVINLKFRNQIVCTRKDAPAEKPLVAVAAVQPQAEPANAPQVDAKPEQAPKPQAAAQKPQQADPKPQQASGKPQQPAAKPQQPASKPKPDNAKPANASGKPQQAAKPKQANAKPQSGSAKPNQGAKPKPGAAKPKPPAHKPN